VTKVSQNADYPNPSDDTQTDPAYEDHTIDPNTKSIYYYDAPGPMVLFSYNDLQPGD
jgi:hypothetical protein